MSPLLGLFVCASIRLILGAYSCISIRSRPVTLILPYNYHANTYFSNVTKVSKLDMENKLVLFSANLTLFNS